MFSYIVRRLATVIPLLLLVAMLTFSLSYLAPGDPVLVMLGENNVADPAMLTRLRHELGFDQPAPVRFIHWIGGAARGDFGRSPFLNISVGSEIITRAQVTLPLAVIAVTITMVLGVPIGILAAWNRGARIDALFTAVTSLGFAIPSFIFGILLAHFFGARLRWLPAAGFTPMNESVVGSVRSLLLPSISLALANTAFIARLMRNQCIEVLGSPYIRAARARGISGTRLLSAHVFRNSISTSLSAFGVILGSALSGSVVIELVFGLPGLGQFTLNALLNRDFLVVQDVMLVVTTLHVLATLAADVTLGLIDPRVRT